MISCFFFVCGGGGENGLFFCTRKMKYYSVQSSLCFVLRKLEEIKALICINDLEIRTEKEKERILHYKKNSSVNHSSPLKCENVKYLTLETCKLVNVNANRFWL